MDWAQLVSNTTDLLEVASDCWLNDRRIEAVTKANQLNLLEARVKRRAELATLSSQMSRIAEVDARIVLIEVAEGFPDRDRFLNQLKALRKRLVEGN